MSKSNVAIDLNEYTKRVCTEYCRYYNATREVNIVNGHPNQKWDWLFHAKCSSCPLEAMIQVLKEEHDQYAELELELV